VRSLPLLVDPSDGVQRYFVAENLDLIAVWSSLPATPTTLVGVANFLCTNCGVLLLWNTPLTTSTVTVNSAIHTDVCIDSTIAVGPWTLCHVKSGRPGTYTLVVADTQGVYQRVSATVS